MIDLLLAHGVVVTMDPDRTILEDGAVAIEGQRIVAVGPTDAIAAAYSARRILVERITGGEELLVRAVEG